jgi:RNA polymerase sigma-70 factor (sigma-E family)
MRPDEERTYAEYVAGRQRWLRRVAFRLCGDWDHADDIAQQVWVLLYQHWSKAVKAESIDGYVRRMVLNAWLGDRRLSWSRRVRPVPAVPDEAAPAAEHEPRLDVLNALGRLTRPQRAVLVFRFWEGLSVAETAELLRCSEGTVKSQTARALAALRKLMPEYMASGQSKERP